MTEEVAIGIDIGSTYCSLAICQNGVVTVIPNDSGLLHTPTYVTIMGRPDDVIIVGHGSKVRAHENLERTIFDVKRLLGRRIFDSFVQRDQGQQLWPFRLTTEKFIIKIEVDDRKYSLEEIFAHLLHFLRKTGEDFLHQKITRAVIAVPSYFHVHQVDAILRAAQRVDLSVMKIVQEPIAAAIAYNHFLQSESHGGSGGGGRRSSSGAKSPNQTDNDEGGEGGDEELRKCLIFDLGGGTLDLAIVTMAGGIVEMNTSDGHSRIGGDNFDFAMVDHCIEKFKEDHGLDLRSQGRMSGDHSHSHHDVEKRREAMKAMRQLKFECEAAKKILFSPDPRKRAAEARIKICSLFNQKDMDVTFDVKLFNELNQDKFEKCIEIVERVIEYSGLTIPEITDVVMVGGSCRIPRIQEMLSQYFGKKPLEMHIDPQTAVVIGSAIEAAAALKNVKNNGEHELVCRKCSTSSNQAADDVVVTTAGVRTLAIDGEMTHQPKGKDGAGKNVASADNNTTRKVSWGTEENNLTVVVDGREGGKMEGGKRTTGRKLFTVPKPFRVHFDLLSMEKKDEQKRQKKEAKAKALSSTSVV